MRFQMAVSHDDEDRRRVRLEQTFPLSSVTDERPVTVTAVNCDSAMRTRLQDLGLMPGCKVQYLYPSAFGDPRAYLIREAVIAIRNADAFQILCQKGGEE